MTQFARFNPAAVSPSPVTGWYDTAVFAYPDLPPSNALVQTTEQQWQQHFDNPNGWTVNSGKLMAPND
jgi:hypothetical protein